MAVAKSSNLVLWSLHQNQMQNSPVQLPDHAIYQLSLSATYSFILNHLWVCHSNPFCCASYNSSEDALIDGGRNELLQSYSFWGRHTVNDWHRMEQKQNCMQQKQKFWHHLHWHWRRFCISPSKEMSQ